VTLETGASARAGNHSEIVAVDGLELRIALTRAGGSAG
jgi:hypothetical protein